MSRVSVTNAQLPCGYCCNTGIVVEQHPYRYGNIDLPCPRCREDDYYGAIDQLEPDHEEYDPVG